MLARFWTGALLATLLLGAIACRGEITDDDIALWANSPAGWDKIGQVVDDPEVPVAIKVKALEKLVMLGNASKAKDILYQAKVREDLAKGLKEVLMARFPTVDGEERFLTKDGLLMILRYFAPAEQAPIQKQIADWVFGGLSDADDTEKIKEQVEKRIMVSQVPDLGAAGIDGAVLLLSRGFGVDRMFRALKEQGQSSPEALTKALGAFRKLHKIPNIEISPSHLQMISELKTIEAVEYLIDIYYMQDQDDTVREDALALAIDLFDDKEVQKHSDKLVPILLRVMKEQHAENRRLAAHYVLKLGGPAYLDQVLAGFPDDRTFTVGSMEMQPFLRDFCVDDLLTLPTTTVVPRLRQEVEKGENRFVRVLALVCLKMTADPIHADLFRALSKDRTDVSDLVGEGTTLGRMADNALTAVDRIKKLRADVEAGSVPKGDAELKSAFYLSNLEFADKFLDDFVQLKFEAAKRRTEPAQ